MGNEKEKGKKKQPNLHTRGISINEMASMTNLPWAGLRRASAEAPTNAEGLPVWSW